MGREQDRVASWSSSPIPVVENRGRGAVEMTRWDLLGAMSRERPGVHVGA